MKNILTNWSHNFACKGIVFAFFGIDSSLLINCFDSSFVSDAVKQWTQVSSIDMNRCKNSVLLLRNLATHMKHPFFGSIVHCQSICDLRQFFKCLPRLPLGDFLHHLARGHLIWLITAMFLFAAHTTSFKLCYTIFYCCKRMNWLPHSKI